MSSTEGRHSNRLYEIAVKRDLKHNYLVHLAHGLLGQTGFRLVNAPTFMPAFILLLSHGSGFAVGLCLSLQAFGMMLSPMLGAYLVEHRKRVMPAGLIAGASMRMMVLCIALVGLWLPANQALWALCLCLLMLGIFMGIQGVIFNFLMAKVIPTNKRGRLTGLRNFLSGLTTSAVAWIAGEYLIGAVPTAEGYAHTFLLAFVLTSVGLLLFAFTREPSPPELRQPTALLKRFQEIPALLRADRVFRHYIWARSLATMGRMAAPFYIIYAGINIGITGQTLGLLTFAFTLSGTLSNIIWGAIADRYGFRVVLLLSLLLWIITTLALMTTSELYPISLIFCGIGAAFQGFQQASMNITLEFGNIKNLPMRIALANTAAEFAGAIGPLLGGLLATQFSYQAVFWVSVSFLTIGGLMILWLVPEPRQRNKRF